MTDGTTYFAIRVDADNFKLATTSGNAGSNTALTITGGTGEVLQMYFQAQEMDWLMVKHIMQ